MKSQSNRPQWWLLYLMVALFIGVLVYMGLTPGPAGHGILPMAVMLVLYGAIMTWIIANQGAVREEEILQRDAAIHRRQMPTTRRQAQYRLAMMRRPALIRTGNHDETI